MVGVINPNISMSIDHQKQRARDSAYMLNPGESFPPESPVSSVIPGPTSTPSPYTAPSKASTGKKNHDISAGVITGIVVATVGVILLGAVVFLLCCRNRTLKENFRRNTEQVSSSTVPWQFEQPFSPSAQTYCQTPVHELPGQQSGDPNGKW
jgi:hypothetical protein